MIDPNGKPIINVNDSSKWFSEHVGFMFSKGVIFDEYDNEQLSNILSLFNLDNYGTGFLTNIYKVYSYTDSQVKILEKKFNISSGNYHILLIPIVYKQKGESEAPGESDEAPDEDYDTVGPVKKMMNWNEITDYFTDVMEKYGFIHDYKVNEGKHYDNPRKDISIDTYIDDDDPDKIMLDKQLAFEKEKANTFDNRVRNSHRKRYLSSDDPNKNRIKRRSLFSRINNDDIADNSCVDPIHIYSREQNNNIALEKNTFYNIYDDQESPHSSLMSDKTVMPKIVIPKMNKSVNGMRYNSNTRYGNIKLETSME